MTRRVESGHVESHPFRWALSPTTDVERIVQVVNHSHQETGCRPDLELRCGVRLGRVD